jgi:alcohol dehydrogenase class IV
VAVPTTAGTGAELSRAAILSWSDKGVKKGMRGEALFPSAAVVDPELTLTMSPEQTRVTGFDVFTHAVETYISRRASETTADLSRRAVVAVCRYLPQVLSQPDDTEARTQMSLHSMLMGYNLANASTCLPHRLQYPIGARTGVAHALCLAALYPAWLEVTMDASRERFQHIAEWMGEGLGDGSAGAGVRGQLQRFMERIGLQPLLSEMGVDEEMIPGLVASVQEDLSNDPWWEPGKDAGVILRKALVLT